MIPYIIQSFRGGISDENGVGIKGSFKFGYGMDIHKRQDSLSCKQALQTVLNNKSDMRTDLIRHFVTASDGSTYAFGAGGSIYCRAGTPVGDNAWNFIYKDSNGEITGAKEWKLSDGKNYIFWCSATSVARKPFGPSADADHGNDDWTDVTENWRTTLTSADWHTMEIATGNLLIANNNKLAMIDYDGGFTDDALTIVPGNRLKCLEERDDYAIMGTERIDEAEEGHIWSWQSESLNYIQKKKVPAKGVNALIQTELMLLQAGDEGELFYSDFSNMTPVHSIPGGGYVNPGGVSIEDKRAVFGFYGGTYPGVWSYGRAMRNRPFVLNYDYRLVAGIAGSTITEIGAVKMVGGDLLVSWKTTGRRDGSDYEEYGVDQVSSSTKATALYEGLEFDAKKPFMKKGQQIIKITMKPLPAGCSVSVKYKHDKYDIWRYGVVGTGGTTFSLLNAKEAEFLASGEAKIMEIGMELNPSVNEEPEIYSINTYINEVGSEY